MGFIVFILVIGVFALGIVAGLHLAWWALAACIGLCVLWFSTGAKRPLDGQGGESAFMTSLVVLIFFIGTVVGLTWWWSETVAFRPWFDKFTEALLR